MLPETPADLRHIIPFLQRASELKAREPVMAYYCGFYAANLALSKGYRKTPETDAFLASLFNGLEEVQRSLLIMQEKKAVAGHAALRSPKAGMAFVLEFASRVFLAADNEDRAGAATKKTAKTFLVASHFYEVGRGFGEDLPREMEERAKYARWKAADIVKAINEGRQPVAGPPSTELLETFESDGPAFRRMSAKAVPQQLRESDEAADGLTSRRPSTVTTLSASLFGAAPSANPMPPAVPAHGLPSAPFANPYASIPQDFPASLTSPPQLSAYRPPAASPPSAQRKPSAPPSAALSQHPSMAEILDRAKALSEAEKATRYALSSVQFEDIGSAVSNLERALGLLRHLAPK